MDKRESEDTFFLLVRTDCEATQHRVKDAALGERSVRGLAELLEGVGLTGTFMVLPTDVEASPALYRDVAASGFEIGLHIHPADQGYEEFLGVYGADQQRAIIGEASTRLANVMCSTARSVCPGYHSANDHTFPVLAELGFQQGQVSMPTRVLPECASVWAGAPFDAHYAHPNNRVLAGTLDFVEIPPTVDPESRMWGGKHPLDLRVELVDAKNHWYTIAKAVDRQLRENSPVKFISITTHNTFEYGLSGDFRRQTLEKMLGAVRQIVAAKGCVLRSVTCAQLAAEVRKVCPREAAG